MVNVIHKSIIAFVLLLLVTMCIGGQSTAAEKSTFIQKQAESFVANMGQVRDQYNNPRPEIDFKLPAGALNIFIGAGELHYQWANPLTRHEDGSVLTYEGYRLDVTLEGANANARPIAEEASAYFERYYTHNLDGAVAPAYNRVIYPEIYPHIDWVLYMTNEGLKYDFIVRPGGDVADIRIKYDGAQKLLNEHGNITAYTPMGSITERAPYTYYAGTDLAVPSAYMLEGNTVKFEVGENNGNIVIDPSLEWASYMGGGNEDRGMCASSDTAGNVYMAGRTASGSSTNVYTSGAHQVSFAGQEDGFVTRYTAGGVRIWSTYYGGGGKEAINAITVDKQNNIIFCGWTDTSSTGIASPGSHQPGYGGGGSDCFVVKMNPSGQRMWGTYYGGAGDERDGNDYQTGIVCDTALNIYLAGITKSDTGIASGSAYQSTRGGGFDGFIAKFNTNGVRQWATYYGGTADDGFTIVGADSAGVIYAAGNFQSTSMGTASTHSQNKPGGSSIDVLIGKFNPANGNRIWATYYGGSGIDVARGLVVGDSSNVYICGSTESSTGISTTGTAQPGFGGLRDMFLSKFDSTGNRLWGTYLGDNNTDNGGNVVLDHSGNLNTTGNTYASSGLATPDGFNTTIGGNVDAFIAIYNPSGDKIWATYYGGSDNDYGYGVARGKSGGHMYIVGNTASSTGISYNGAQNTYGGGTNDAFILKITPDTSVSIVKTSVQNTYCERDTFTISYVVTEPFRPNNVYTVQLSNSSGSFASPVNIGTKTSSTPGNISVSLPAGATGTGFRIRIVATLPIDTSYDNDFDINIKPLPSKPVASNNSPVCSNDTLKLFSSLSTSGSVYAWTGPDTYTASTRNAIRTNMTAAAHSGSYIVTANLNGCIQKDTTNATIIQAAPKPDLTSNSPLCSGDNLVMSASNLTTNMQMKWTGPNSFSDTGTITTATVSRGKSNVALADAGNYIFTIWMNNCPSRDTVAVTVAQKPNPVTAGSNSPVCTHETLQLTANTTTPGVVYNWTGPSFVANNQQNPTRTNLQTSHSGNYIVEADMLGCKVRDTVTVTINQSPAKPVASANKTAICSDEDLILTGSNITGPTRLWTHAGSSWNGGTNNNTATRYNIQVADGGDYIFTVSNSNGCQQRDTVNITVTQSYPIPITAVASPGTVVCPTTPMLFIPIGTPIGAQVKWTDPNMVIHPKDTLDLPSAVYSDSGWYVVEVVTGACSLAVDSVHLSVVDTISPPLITLPSYACEGDTLKLNITHPHLDSFSLTYPGGAIIKPFKTITFNGLTIPDNHGTYIVKVQSGGCTAYDTGYLEVRSRPAEPVATSNGPLCEGETLDLTANSSTSSVTYSWVGPSGYTSTIQNPSIANVDSATHAGWYMSRAFINGCFSTPDSTLVEIILNPSPEIVTNSPVCEGANIVMGIAGKPDETYTWSSVSNTGFSGSGQSASINNAGKDDGGVYVVTAKSGTTGCTGYDSVYVQVIPLPGVPEAIANAPLCDGDTLVLDVNDTSTNVTYTWTGPGNFTGTDKQTVRGPVNVAGSGMYIVTVNRDKCSLQDSVEVTIKPRPAQPDIKSNSPLVAGETLYLEMLNPETGASFQWKGPNGYGSLVQNPVIENATTAATGTYSLVTTLNGCSSSAITIVVVNAGEAEREELILFPNPNKGNFTVKAKVNRDQIMPYEVINVLGMVVYSDIAQTENLEMERKIEVDGGLSSGVYIFRIMMSGKNREIPFSIVR